MKTLKRPNIPYVVKVPYEGKIKRRIWVMVVGKHDDWPLVLRLARELWRKGRIVVCHTDEEGKVPEGEKLMHLWKSAPLYPVWRGFVDPVIGEMALDMALWARKHSGLQVYEVLEEVEKRTGIRLYEAVHEAKKAVLKDVHEAWIEYLEGGQDL